MTRNVYRIAQRRNCKTKMYNFSLKFYLDEIINGIGNEHHHVPIAVWRVRFASIQHLIEHTWCELLFLSHYQSIYFPCSISKFQLHRPFSLLLVQMRSLSWKAAMNRKRQIEIAKVSFVEIYVMVRSRLGPTSVGCHFAICKYFTWN